VVDVPVIAVGGMNDPAAAEAALAARKCDLVAIGRGLIADAFWVEKVQQGRASEIIECVQCNEGCFGNLRSGKPIGCTQNPESGNEYLHR
jgi:2-enoate reductase